MQQELVPLKNLFRDHTLVLHELGDSLRNQKEAVVHWDLKVLAHEQRVHNQLLVRLRIFDSARVSAEEKLSQRLGMHGRKPMKELLQAITHSDGDELRRANDNLLAIAGTVRELYDENHKYLSHALEGIEGSLTVLNAAKQKGATYTRSSNGARGAEVPRHDNEARFLDQNV